MRLFAPTIRSLHVLALITYYSLNRLRFRYVNIVPINPRPPLSWRARLVVSLMVGPILQHLFPRQIRNQPLSSRHQRDIARRRVRLLLTILGDTPKAIDSTLRRLNAVGSLSPAREWHTPLEAYLCSRTGHDVEIGPLLTKVDHTFHVVTPTTIRNYLHTTMSTPT